MEDESNERDTRDKRDDHRSDALMWMLDHRDETIHAEIRVTQGDASYTLVTIDGVLRRWRDSASREASRTTQRYDIEGLFMVGEVSLDLTDIADNAEVTIDDRKGTLHVRLDDHVWLYVNEKE